MTKKEALDFLSVVDCVESEYGEDIGSIMERIDSQFPLMPTDYTEWGDNGQYPTQIYYNLENGTFRTEIIDDDGRTRVWIDNYYPEFGDHFATDEDGWLDFPADDYKIIY